MTVHIPINNTHENEIRFQPFRRTITVPCNFWEKGWKRIFLPVKSTLRGKQQTCRPFHPHQKVRDFLLLYFRCTIVSRLLYYRLICILLWRPTLPRNLFAPATDSRTITSDQIIVYDNSSSFWIHRYITRQKLLRSNKFIIRFARVISQYTWSWENIAIVSTCVARHSNARLT